MGTDFRFIGISPSVDLTERRSKMINEQTEPFTLDEMRGYKVYTALLTQSGGSNAASIEDAFLTIGITYQITDQGGSGWDFTNVGAPNNNVGTYFVATGATPTSWGNGVSLSYNTGAPVATVLENTIGNIWFLYGADGSYSIISDGLFIDNKTTTFGSQYNQDTGVFVYFQTTGAATISEIPILTGDGTLTNGYLQNTPIEIRVYN